MARRVKVYWFKGPDLGFFDGFGRGNFGDVLGPHLLRELQGVEPEWAEPREAELVLCGSVVGKLPDGWSGTLLGTGTVEEGVVRDLSDARVLAVRGALTRDRLGLGSVPLGDPGILVSLIAPRVERHGTSVAPHYRDDGLAARYPAARRIRVTAPPTEVIAAIAGSERVVTSSLHVMVAADSLGIPHKLEPSSAVFGGLWKYRDYLSAFDEELEMGVWRLTPRAAMEARQAELRHCLAAI